MAIAVLSITVWGCKTEKTETSEDQINEIVEVVEEEELREFGFNLKDFIVKRDTIKKGDSFGKILERNNITYPQIFNIAEKAKDTFDIRKLQLGKPYTLLCSKDSLEQPRCFIYQPNKEEYVVINFQDTIHAYTSRKPIKFVEKTATGVIENNISETLEEQGLSVALAYKMADDIYAWTIDFRRLQEGDKFKVIYTDKYIDDTIYAGLHNIKAALFEHKNEQLYAFEFETDSLKGIIDYFNEDAKNLRRAFLKAPVKYKRISSRYNLRRRIAHYGYKVRPHRGTDFSANIGTPIMATANGTVTKASYTRGNGNYVKIRHNATYET
ncbi:MAG: peptidoglycan DD-metalloendopeptidase family protein, partial [Winogradskyella sp.]|nr:peptidoglycan DD-metalloendopeptidase family protein [Winogradskyella sp.]